VQCPREQFAVVKSCERVHIVIDIVPHPCFSFRLQPVAPEAAQLKLRDRCLGWSIGTTKALRDVLQASSLVRAHDP